MIKFSEILLESFAPKTQKKTYQDVINLYNDERAHGEYVPLGQGIEKIIFTKDFGKYKAGDKISINIFGESNKEVIVQTKKGKVRNIPRDVFILV